MLANLVSRARENDQINGVIPHLVDGGLSIMQYADDTTILFLEDDLEQAHNLKLVLCALEKLSGLKINFHKSELICFGNAKRKSERYMQVFSCKEGSMPFKYLGILMSHQKLANKD